MLLGPSCFCLMSGQFVFDGLSGSSQTGRAFLVLPWMKILLASSSYLGVCKTTYTEVNCGVKYTAFCWFTRRFQIDKRSCLVSY